MSEDCDALSDRQDALQHALELALQAEQLAFDTLSQLKRDQELVASHLDETLGNRDEAHSRFIDADVELGEAVARLTEAESALADKKQAAADIEGEIADYESEVMTAQSDLEEAQDKHDETSNKIQTLTALLERIDETEHALATIAAQLDSSTLTPVQRAALQAQYELLLAELAALEAQRNTLGDLTALVDELGKHEDKLNEKHAKISEYTEKIDQLAGKLDELELETSAIIGDITQTEVDIQDIEQRIDTLLEEVALFDSMAADMSQTLQEMDDAIQREESAYDAQFEQTRDAYRDWFGAWDKWRAHCG